MMRRLCFSLLFGCLILGFSGSANSAGDFDDLLFERFAKNNPFKNQENVALEKSGATAVVQSAPIKDAPTFNASNADSFLSFNYVHSFQPVTLEKVRLIVLKSSDTGFRATSPNKTIPPKDFVTYIREIQVFSSDQK